MVLVVVFAVALLIAVLLSGPAARTVLSTSFLFLVFLVGGALVSDGFLGLIHITPDLAAFSAGAVLTARSLEAKGAFEPIGEALAEPATFAGLPVFGVLLVFGALLTPQLFGDLPFGGYIAVVLAVVLIRPASLPLSLLGTRFTRQEKLAAACSGRKASPWSCTGCWSCRPEPRRARRRSR